ncbi:1-phosphofructokinase family hexose kinase [Cellulophaga sp. Hel_I_12]|uniref:1-phosphofructokinase family hexose kinase n=1 Tax=Cellulophaga sp. Hel_I_12 TaxID=1249972 RepID=UPI00064791F8|nr:1-phosphofructokinase family hexose kinase [Cellulophaga sp. Hel_I_12]
MKNIVTLTVNPAIDKSTTVTCIKPNSKLRCTTPIFEAGGGGINISRVIHELNEISTCLYLAGGPTGTHLHQLLEAENISQQMIPILGWTRENLAVTDTTTHQQFRFGMPGPDVSEEECTKVLKHLELILSEGDYLVASGSLSPKMSVDFFAKVATIAKSKKVKFILDSSGEPLVYGAKAGVFLLKPNLGELSRLCGVDAIHFSEIETLAQNFLRNNPCEVMVVSLGPQGAVMVTKNTVDYIAAPIVLQQSTIGAGDSMVAGMILGLAQGKSLVEMAKYGVACGTAATMTPGTQLCRKKDVDALYKWITENSKENTKININT